MGTEAELLGPAAAAGACAGGRQAWGSYAGARVRGSDMAVARRVRGSLGATPRFKCAMQCLPKQGLKYVSARN